MRGRTGTNAWNDPELLPTMPLLDALHAELGGLHGKLTAFFGLQHLFGSTTSLVRRLTAGRIVPSRVFLLGKPYSANRRVMAHQRDALGYRVHPASCRQPVGRAQEGELDRRVEQVLAAIRRKISRNGDGSRVLLIDDGGRAIRALHTDRHADIRHRFIGVEQTRKGVRALDGLKLEIPVINVAESWVKLEHESPLIAESVNDELCAKLDAMETAGISTGGCALVIGYGAIGRSIASVLRDRVRDVTVYDANDEARRRASDHGYRTEDDLEHALRHGGLVIGCTGRSVLGEAELRSIPAGTILVSASSADVEFRGWTLRPGSESLGNPATWHDGRANGSDPHHPCFSLYRVDRGNGWFYLVNGGFPVNFDGGVDPIAPEKIQLTRGLLLAGAIQASRTQHPGLHDLEDGIQRMLLDRFTSAAARAAA